MTTSLATGPLSPPVGTVPCPTTSLQDGLRTVGGITVGLLTWGVLAVAGLAAVLAASATAYTVIKLAGATHLVFLGIHALIHSRRTQAQAVDMLPAAPVGNPWRTGPSPASS
ncbi:LysE family transporter [Streptomyces bluensis]|uniref:LysE family transporter n=1 Tax=Streptomyces bluensis TaxID=33897 RepID=UPI0036BAB8D3